jgi:hypothetical protein
MWNFIIGVGMVFNAVLINTSWLEMVWNILNLKKPWKLFGVMLKYLC